MKVIECPRDAMQGIDAFIPTKDKIRYINQLLKVGFDVIDFGSFVSPKAIPQMRDTATVVDQLEVDTSTISRLLAIVANIRGAKEASSFNKINYVGFPLSISETFQRRNTNKSIPQALNELEEIKNICISKGKLLVVYISMGFGNPYGDPYYPDLVANFVDIVQTLGADTVSLADTIGVSTPQNIHDVFTSVRAAFPKADLGVHLHSTPSASLEKIEAAYKAGCTRLEGALKGYGGCPMADNELVGNIATEQILRYLRSKGVDSRIDEVELARALKMADEIFPPHG